MNIFGYAQKLMSMSEESWARHSNPLSVYTRVTCLPLLSLAIWSRKHIDLYSLVFVAIALFWTWYNPRAFRPPVTTDNWASKGTFGDRIFLQQPSVSIPDHHKRMAYILSALSALALPTLLYGLYVNDLWVIAFGNFLVILPKLWFVDRMVWIYEDMKDSNPEYKRWLKTKS